MKNHILLKAMAEQAGNEVIRTEECMKLVRSSNSSHLAHFSAAGGREGWMGPSPKVGRDYSFEKTNYHAQGNDVIGMVCLQALTWNLVCWLVDCAQFGGDQKSASQVESHSDDPIRMTEILGRGGGMGQPSNEPVPSQSASQLDSMQNAHTGFYEPVLRFCQHEAATDAR